MSRLSNSPWFYGIGSHEYRYTAYCTLYPGESEASCGNLKIGFDARSHLSRDEKIRHAEEKIELYRDRIIDRVRLQNPDLATDGFYIVVDTVFEHTWLTLPVRLIANWLWS